MGLEQTRKRIEAVIEGRDRNSRLAKLLFGAGFFYGFSMNFRSKLYKSGILETRKLSCKVISIGNISLGGTGKTPMALYTARLVISMGLRPAMVYRGYGGACENSFGVVSDGCKILMGPEDSGDEPFLVATALSGVPVVVGKNRAASGQKAIELFNPNVIILDDAFQHIRLRRDIDLLLMDSEKPFGNEKLFPGGPLREPSEQAMRADALIATRFDSPGKENAIFKRSSGASGIPVFRCRHAPGPVSLMKGNGSAENRDIAEIAGKKCLAFSGIANNKDFKRVLSETGCAPIASLHFPDHHKYSRRDIDAVLDAARKNGADTLVTTEKDAVKLLKRDFFPFRIYSLGVRISFVRGDGRRFSDFIRKRLALGSIFGR